MMINCSLAVNDFKIDIRSSHLRFNRLQMRGAIEVQLVGTGMVKSFKLIPQSLLHIKPFL